MDCEAVQQPMTTQQPIEPLPRTTAMSCVDCFINWHCHKWHYIYSTMKSKTGVSVPEATRKAYHTVKSTMEYLYLFLDSIPGVPCNNDLPEYVNRLKSHVQHALQRAKDAGFPSNEKGVDAIPVTRFESWCTKNLDKLPMGPTSADMKEAMSLNLIPSDFKLREMKLIPKRKRKRSNDNNTRS